MIKRVTSVFLVLTMLLATIVGAVEVGAEATNAQDLFPDTWYKDAVTSGLELGYIRESELTENPTVDWESKIGFIVMVSRAFGLYDDSEEEFYISKYNHFNALVTLGIISEENYLIDDWARPLGRFEAAQICANILKVKENYIKPEGISYIDIIPDRASIPEVYKEPVDMVYSAGIITGMDDTLVMTGWNGVTKAESYTILHRLVNPEVRKKINLEYTKLFGSYTTSYGKPYNKYREGSIFNMVRAGEFINEYIIEPGETFSFNKVVGNPGAENGFMRGYVLSGGELIPGYGGGVCQASTTLFNAALQANMEIVERHNHGAKPNYVPGGADSSIVYSQWDLRFKNTYTTPVKIIFTNNKDNKSLTFEIYGSGEVTLPKVEYTTKHTGGRSYELVRTVDGVVNYTCKTRYNK